MKSGSFFVSIIDVISLQGGFHAARNTSKLEGLEVYEVRPLNNDIYKGIHVEWSAPQLGWGEWSLVWSDEDGNFHLMTECMDGAESDNREFSKAILMKILEGCVIDE